MKKLIYGAVAVFFAALTALAAVGGGGGQTSGAGADTEFIRIHIRANSNSQSDQQIKYAVKDEIVRYLTPVLAACGTRAAAKSAIEGNLTGIGAAASAKLKQEGYAYGASAALTSEYFPVRAYGDVTLGAGIYDALIVLLGGGAGDNWWCVVYPPLCFIDTEYVNGEGIRYKSKIVQTVKKWFGK